MSPRTPAAIAIALVLSACTGGRTQTAQQTAESSGSASPAPTAPRPTPVPTAAATGSSVGPSVHASATAPTPSPREPRASAVAPTPSADPSLPTTFGPGPAWPRAPRTAAPPAYGAVITRRVAPVSGGGTLAAGLLLPRLDANTASPLVMTPCGRRVRIRGSDLRPVPPGSGGPLPKAARDVLVLVDPGHGGPANGAIGTDGSREADRVLALAKEVAAIADGSLGRVFLTRARDFDATLEFRVALGDSLRADAAVAVHLNAEADGRLDRPGVETYGSVSDPQGRRLAGVMYEAQRRYLQRFPGPWTGDRDAGAKNRLGRTGGDYYGLLRRAHVPWVISESLFMSSAHDIALLDRPDFVTGLAATIADAARVFTTTRTPGSGWVQPYPRQPNPTPAPGSVPRCVDPAR